MSKEDQLRAALQALYDWVENNVPYGLQDEALATQVNDALAKS